MSFKTLTATLHSIELHFDYIECPIRYRTRHFFNNFTTNKDIATKFEADYRHTLQTHSFSFLTQGTYSYDIFIGVRIIKEMPGSVASGTHCTFSYALNAKINMGMLPFWKTFYLIPPMNFYLFAGACFQHITLRMLFSNVKLCVYQRNCLSCETNSKLLLIQCKKSY